MPIDPTEPSPTTGTDRRAFLARGVAGGALVATVATAGLTSGLGVGLTPAGAQEGASAPPTVTQEFAALAAPLELAAALAYQAALAGDTVSDDWVTVLRRFQRNHQEVAATLTGVLQEDTPAPVADPDIAASFSPPPGADETAIFTLLASLEEALAATHLGAIGTFDDSSFARTVAQVLATEQQQAVALGRAAGTPLDALTPPTATTDGALAPGAPVSQVADDEDTGTDSGSGSGSETTDDTTNDDAGSGASNTGSGGGTDTNSGAGTGAGADSGTNSGAGTNSGSGN